MKAVEQVEATLSVDACIANYFAQVEPFIMRQLDVYDSRDKVDYFLLKRFLNTAFNNLQSLDGRLYFDNEIQDLRQTLKTAELIHNDLTTKLRHSKFCFEVVFLGQQPEFIQNQSFRNYARKRMRNLQNIAETIAPVVEAHQADNPKALEPKLKETKKEYVETIHERANLSEKLRQFTHLRQLYTAHYYEPFTEAFAAKAKKYQELMRRILDVRVLELDRVLWKKAAESHSIRAFFKEAQITGGYSTRVYLRYYLKALDPSKMNPEHYALQELLHYLESLPEDIEYFAV
jgi:hypothetical protein